MKWGLGLGPGVGSFIYSVNNLHPRCSLHLSSPISTPYTCPFLILSTLKTGRDTVLTLFLLWEDGQNWWRNPSRYQADISVVSKRSDEIKRESERTTPPSWASSVDTTNDRGGSWCGCLSTKAVPMFITQSTTGSPLSLSFSEQSISHLGDISLTLLLQNKNERWNIKSPPGWLYLPGSTSSDRSELAFF